MVFLPIFTPGKMNLARLFEFWWVSVPGWRACTTGLNGYKVSGDDPRIKPKWLSE
jgi:hypothetical protein